MKHPYKQPARAPPKVPSSQSLLGTPLSETEEPCKLTRANTEKELGGVVSRTRSRGFTEDEAAAACGTPTTRMVPEWGGDSPDATAGSWFRDFWPLQLCCAVNLETANQGPR